MRAIGLLEIFFVAKNSVTINAENGANRWIIGEEQHFHDRATRPN